MTTTTSAATDTLTDLVQSARQLSSRAITARRHGLGGRILTLACDLDATRTRLVQDGPDYLEAAWAFIDAGRRILAGYTVQLDAEMTGWTRC
jgi:hypothetical protein